MSNETFNTILVCVGLTGVVLVTYFTHRSKTSKRINELENRIVKMDAQVQNHEKFVSILEKEMMKGLAEKFKGQDTNTGQKSNNGKSKQK